MKKKIALFFVLIGLVISSSYFFFSSKQSAVGKLELTEKYATYATIEYLFLYPPTWFVNHIDNTGIGSYTSIANFKPDIFSSPYISGDYYGIEIVSLNNNEKLSLDNWVNKFVAESESQPKVLKTEKILIDGHEAVYNIELVQGNTHPIVYIKKGDLVYLINSGPLKPDFEIVFKTLLNSFKFVN